MRSKYYYVTLLLPLLFCNQTVTAAPAYTELSRPVSDSPEVVEFFSFYCGACYRFADSVAAALRDRLPAGTTFVKYHVNKIGELGPALSMA